MAACDILLAAYNGAAYGPALLDSLLAQTFSDFNLIVRDDGSSDNTLEMLRAYAPKFGGRMSMLPASAPTGSARGNFSLLMEESTAPYALCADIDDVWLPTKIADTLDLLTRTEQEFGASTPVYVFTDVTPVDKNLVPLSDSFWEFKKIDPTVGCNLSQSLVCPVALGCASGMNRALMKLVTPVPETVTGHDWWALLVALAFGQVRYSTDRTMLYRLHGNNVSNQRRISFLGLLSRKEQLEFVRYGMRRRADQGQALLERFGATLRPHDRDIVERFVSTGSQGFFERRLSLLKGNYLYPDLPRNLAMLMFV